MILMRENPFRGPLEGRCALKIETLFLGPEMATCEATAVWASKKSRFSGPSPSNGQAGQSEFIMSPPHPHPNSPLYNLEIDSDMKSA